MGAGAPADRPGRLRGHALAEVAGMRRLGLLLLPLLAACALVSPRDSLDAAARDYVVLQLAIGEKEEGYIDAYYGPEELKAAGKAIGQAETTEQLASRVTALMIRVAALGMPCCSSPEDGRRSRFLHAQLNAASM